MYNVTRPRLETSVDELTAAVVEGKDGIRRFRAGKDLVGDELVENLH
jgi:hypothetical protein